MKPYRIEALPVSQLQDLVQAGRLLSFFSRHVPPCTMCSFL